MNAKRSINRISAVVITFLALGTLLFALSSCRNGDGVASVGPAEQAGRSLDQANEKAGRDLNELADRATEGIGKAAQETRNTIDEAAEGVSDGLDNATEAVGKRVERAGEQIRDSTQEQTQ